METEPMMFVGGPLDGREQIITKGCPYLIIPKREVLKNGFIRIAHVKYVRGKSAYDENCFLKYVKYNYKGYQ